MRSFTRRAALYALALLPLAAVGTAPARAKPPAPPTATEASIEAVLRKAALADEPKAPLRVSPKTGPWTHGPVEKPATP